MFVEFRRQAAHAAFSLLMIVPAIVLPQTGFLLLCVVLVGVAGILAWQRHPGYLRVVYAFERETHRKVFPAKGAFLLVAGMFFTALLFPAQLVPALLILAIPDSLATLIGSVYGVKKVPWSVRKSWVGSGVFFLSAAGVLVFFTSWWGVVAAALTLAEAIDYHDVLLLDDNVVLPLLTGLLLLLL